MSTAPSPLVLDPHLGASNKPSHAERLWHPQTASPHSPRERGGPWKWGHPWEQGGPRERGGPWERGGPGSGEDPRNAEHGRGLGLLLPRRPPRMRVILRQLGPGFPAEARLVLFGEIGKQ